MFFNLNPIDHLSNMIARYAIYRSNLPSLFANLAPLLNYFISPHCDSLMDPLLHSHFFINGNVPLMRRGPLMNDNESRALIRNHWH